MSSSNFHWPPIDLHMIFEKSSLKNQLHFLFISNLNFEGYTDSKNQVWNRQKIKLIQSNFSNLIFQTWFFKLDFSNLIFQTWFSKIKYKWIGRLAVVQWASHLSFPDLFDRKTNWYYHYVVTSRMNVGLLFLQQTISGKRNTWEIDLFCTLASDREATIAHSCYLTTLMYYYTAFNCRVKQTLHNSFLLDMYFIL